MSILAWIGSIYLIGFVLTWFIAVRLDKPSKGDEFWSILSCIPIAVLWPWYVVFIIIAYGVPLLFFPERGVRKLVDAIWSK